MNRLPTDTLDPRSGDQYEMERARQLAPLLRDAQGGLDLHSTVTPSRPMVLDVTGHPDELDRISDGIPIQDRFQNMVSVQQGIPLSLLIGGVENTDVPVVGIESGSHEDPESVRNAVSITIACLVQMGHLTGSS